MESAIVGDKGSTTLRVMAYQTEKIIIFADIKIIA